MSRTILIVVAAMLTVLAGVAPVVGDGPGSERLYVLDCGTNTGKDQSRWSPGVNEGKAIEFSDNCYLIRHAKGLLLWDTGVPDAVAAMPDGMVVANGAITYRRAKTLMAQLAEIGVKPADVTSVAVSHTHGDHVGNVGMFPQAMLLVQKAEYEWPGPNNAPRFKAEHPVTKLEGDRYVFGDGSVTIIATAGHTPGHQSLLVKLPKTGARVLSGDAVHFQSNWEHRRVPVNNTGQEQSRASMQCIADLLARENATLWINHDKAQRDTLKLAPQYYE